MQSYQRVDIADVGTVMVPTDGTRAERAAIVRQQISVLQREKERGAKFGHAWLQHQTSPAVSGLVNLSEPNDIPEFETPEYGEADEPKSWPLVVALVGMVLGLIRVIRKERHRGTV